MAVSNELMQHIVRQPDSAPEELHYTELAIHRYIVLSHRTTATVRIPNRSTRSSPLWQ